MNRAFQNLAADPNFGNDEVTLIKDRKYSLLQNDSQNNIIKDRVDKNPKNFSPYEFDSLYKIVLIGESNSGKTSMLLRFADSVFSEKYLCTIGVDFKIKTLKIDDKIVKMQVWDTAGQERFRSISIAYYRNSHGCVAIYDISNRSSFDAIEEQIQSFISYSPQDVTRNIILVGNKTDLNAKRQVSYQEGASLAKKLNLAAFFETSAKEDRQVDDVFFRAIVNCVDFYGNDDSALGKVSRNRGYSAQTTRSIRDSTFGHGGEQEEEYNHSQIVLGKDVQYQQRKGKSFTLNKLSVSCKTLKSIRVGQCLMDIFDKSKEKLDNMTLSYNIDEGECHLNFEPHPQALNKPDSWRVYQNLHFEHSNTCPSRKSRKIFEEQNKDFPLAEFPVKMAVCSYIMDKDQNLLVTKRPAFMNIFPHAWVLPGGIVDFGESFEHAMLREIEEEIGITIEAENENDINSKFLFTEMFSHKKFDVDFKPFYLYESVTKNVDEIEDEDEQYPPKGQHLVLFFLAQINEGFRKISLEPKLAEIEKAAWVNLKDFKECFEEKYKMIPGYQVTSELRFFKKPNCEIDTNQFHPLYRHNPKGEGLVIIMSLIPQYFEIREVGKTIKSTKKQYVWRFRLENKDYTIELFTSVLSGKKKILQNGQVIFFDSKFKNAFQFPFNIGKNALNIIQHGDKFELRINNMSFSHLWENERTKRNFNFGEKSSNDPYQAKDYAQNYNTSTKPTSRDQEKAMKQGQYLGYDQRQERQEERQKGLSYSNSDMAQNRQAQQKKEKRRADDWQAPTYDYSTGFDHGFGKFDTNQVSGSNQQQNKRTSKSGVRKQDTSEFFGDEEFKKQEQSNQFDFNFGGSSGQEPQPQPKPQSILKKEEPKQADLMDLLGGGSSANAPQPSGTNALDFFNDINFGQPSEAQQQQQEQKQEPSSDIFGGGAPSQEAKKEGSVFDGAPNQQSQKQESPAQSQQQQAPTQEQNKPKFVPNLGSFFTNQNDMYAMQQQQQYQQQLYMQQMMMNQNPQMMGMGMNSNFGGMGGQGQQPMGGNNFMTNQQYGGNMGTNQQQQYMGQQQQQQNQYQQQQPQMQQQYAQSQGNAGYGNSNQQESTPFDMFS